MQKKDVLKVVLILVSAAFIGCNSYSIKDQKDPSLSLLIIKTNIPDGFAVQTSSVKKSDGINYQSGFTAYNSDNRYNKLMVFENITDGDYRINSLLAETSRSSSSTRVGNATHTTTTWRALDFTFDDSAAENKDMNNGGWFHVKPSSICYAGDIAWFQSSSRDEITDKMSKIFKKSKKDVEKSFLYNFRLKSKKIDEPYFMIKLDHPALIGEKESLKNELAMLVSFKNGKKSKNENWDKIIDTRIVEISQKLGLQQSIKK